MRHMEPRRTGRACDPVRAVRQWSVPGWARWQRLSQLIFPVGRVGYCVTTLQGIVRIPADRAADVLLELDTGLLERRERKTSMSMSRPT